MRYVIIFGDEGGSEIVSKFERATVNFPLRAPGAEERP